MIIDTPSYRSDFRWNVQPRLIDLWVQFRFGSDALAKEAGVPEEVILSLFRFQEVNRATAEKVLAALSRLTRQEYTLENVRINLDQEEMRREQESKRGEP